MGSLVVITPPDLAPGFALGGADSVAATEPGTVVDAVTTALGRGAEVVAVHHTLWRALPGAIRLAYEQRTDRLVLPLPPDDGAPLFDRQAELHELLARAVGYEISFTGEDPR